MLSFEFKLLVKTVTIVLVLFSLAIVIEEKWFPKETPSYWVEFAPILDVEVFIEKPSGGPRGEIG